MKINWFTVIAQAINFLILVWLLKRFLYKPVLKAIADREKRISDQLLDAIAKTIDAKKEQDLFNAKNDEFDRQKKVLADKAVSDANADRQKLLDLAKEDANALRSSLEAEIRENQENRGLEIARKTQEEVFAITRKALADIASLSLEEQSVSTFIRRLNESKDPEKKQFMDAFKSNTNAILVRSAFDLPAKQQGEISNAVDEILNAKAEMQFKKAPELISGVELSTNGYKLSWSFSEYLNSLEKSISVKMKEKPEEASV
jgi:F-type H+-transporting ATPase subunit b